MFIITKKNFFLIEKYFQNPFRPVYSYYSTAVPHLGPLWSVMLILKSMTCHRVSLRRETNGSCESAEFQ